MKLKPRNVITGAGVGAIATYFLDPDQGRRRRAGVRDRLIHYRHALPYDINVTALDLYHRSQGFVAKSKSRLLAQEPDLTDDVIEDRVRAELGRVVSHPHAISVWSEEGNVMLSGLILSHEIKPLLKSVSRVRGVRNIANCLQAHKRDENIPSLQGGAPRPGRKPDVLQSHWAPATRFLMGLTGTTLLSFALARRRQLPLAAAAGITGLLVLSRSITNIETKRILGFGGRKAIQFRKTAHFAAPIDEVYEFWSGFIDFEITVQAPNKVLAWRSAPGALIRHAGNAQFFKDERGDTKVELDFSYNPPAGVFGHTVARVLGIDPKRRIERSLAQMKQIIERGPSPRQERALAS